MKLDATLESPPHSPQNYPPKRLSCHNNSPPARNINAALSEKEGGGEELKLKSLAQNCGLANSLERAHQESFDKTLSVSEQLNPI